MDEVTKHIIGYNRMIVYLPTNYTILVPLFTYNMNG